jgi:hypothetical protein
MIVDRVAEGEGPGTRLSAEVGPDGVSGRHGCHTGRGWAT